MGCRKRLEQVCEDQPTFHYELNVRTKAFHEEPYKNGNKEVRKDYCRADHTDDLAYMFGMMFCLDSFGHWGQLPDGRYFSEDEAALSKRMMKGSTQYSGCTLIIPRLLSKIW